MSLCEKEINKLICYISKLDAILMLDSLRSAKLDVTRRSDYMETKKCHQWIYCISRIYGLRVQALALDEKAFSIKQPTVRV